MKRVPRDRHTFVFAADVEPVLEIEPGEEVVFETLDSWAGRLREPDDIHRLKPDLTRSNPAAGPVYVRGAEPGDALAIDVLSITPHSPAISKITGRPPSDASSRNEPRQEWNAPGGWRALVALRPMTPTPPSHRRGGRGRHDERESPRPDTGSACSGTPTRP